MIVVRILNSVLKFLIKFAPEENLSRCNYSLQEYWVSYDDRLFTTSRIIMDKDESLHDELMRACSQMAVVSDGCS